MDKKEIAAIWQAYLDVQEGKGKKKEALDPVGKEDGDIDNDGDKDSSDEYLAKRRKAVGKAIDKDKEQKEGKLPPALQKAIDKKKGKKTDDDDEDVKESEGSYPTPKKVKKPGDALEPVNNRTAKLKEEDKEECPKCEGKGCSHCDDKGYHMKESTQLDEISRDTVGRALEQRVAQLKKNKEQDTKTWDQIVAAQKKGDKRTYDRLMKDANKLEREREKLRKSIQKLSNDLEFGQRESVLDTSLFSAKELEALEERMETAGATAPEGLMDKESAGSKKFVKDHKKSNAKFENIPAQAAADASKSGKATKQSAARNAGDNLNNGDSKTPGKV